MMVRVDEAGGDDFVGAIDCCRGGGRGEVLPDLRDFVARDEDICLHGVDVVVLGAVDERCAVLEEEGGHPQFLWQYL